jgi:hypothetical protein
MMTDMYRAKVSGLISGVNFPALQACSIQERLVPSLRSRHSIMTCRIALTHILHMGAQIGIMRMYVAVNGSC